MDFLRRIPFGLLSGALMAQLVSTGVAVAEGTEVEHSLFTFGGAMVDGDMAESANPFGVDYEDHPIFGIGYQVFPYSIGSVKLGLEAGLAGRFGGNTNAEIWGGVVGRYDAIEIANTIRIVPSFTFGLSHVTETMKGREKKNEETRDGDASTLFYLGPEVSFSTVSRPELEVFWRLHHRSGAWGTLGDMHGGSNANVLGVRYNF
ncbi:hypothetical protein JZX87_06700 [Agrobacterium sp. Ap1]|uniref:hypothetical protein n=1 Tax=Agrobacterium sp. Ap1 TaxID=2815337 RepID=UPI001A8CB5CB|nr:hypothetical protein [Agrobacterium sp. Ap1]MBO0140859.1 hypothetical protein [Agrobacterium sp. Ap1]